MAGNSVSIDDLIKKTGKLGIVERDESYYGLQGLDPNTVLYRVCRSDQDTNKDIVCKAKPGTPDAERSVNQHINSGSTKDSRFISTTASSDVALKWAYYTKESKDDVKKREVPLPMVKVDLSKMAGMQELKDLINLTDQDVREHFVSGATQINRVKSSQEVLFQWRIPKKNPSGKIVFELWKNPPVPKTP